MIQGRKNILAIIEKALTHNQSPIIWFHCASLGEFEQGRPVMEALKKKHPDYKILLTFFSPSGYEIRKNYAGADWIFYLPFDTYRNASRFVSIVKPACVFFVKYEFWYFYLNELNKKNIPVVLISALFRKNQIFFRWYGGFFANILKKFNHIFLQNATSEMLVKQVGISKASVSGDTRFDRVHAQLNMVTPLPLIESFRHNASMVIVGSAWEEDMELIIPLINHRFPSIRFIVAPHEIHTDVIESWRSRIQVQSELYSEVVKKGSVKAETNVLVIDSIGLLSSIYRYGNYAHVGGAFGKGLHNILEAATFGMPISFGPNIQKFPEASAMIEEKAAMAVSNYGQLFRYFEECMEEETNKQKSVLARNFVQINRGATDKIINYVSPLLNQRL
jgi:3-deoxy-D-manno-octulosonic-acid transferase